MNARGKLNVILFLALVASVGLNWVARRDPTRPNREFLPEMVHTVRYNAFAANPNFSDGKTLQTPVPGTLPRGVVPMHYAATPQDALRAGEELSNPFAAQPTTAEKRGTQVYANFCQPCHGAGGRGDGPVALRGFPAPPSLLLEHAIQMRDGQMFHILTYGQKNMPSYASQISPEDRWKVVLFVRSLQRQAPPQRPGDRP